MEWYKIFILLTYTFVVFTWGVYFGRKDGE